MYHKYLARLSDGDYRRLHWYATHPPAPRRLEDLPPDQSLIAQYARLSWFEPGRKLFPLYKHYKFAAVKFGLPVAPRYKPGVPSDIIPYFSDYRMPPSYHKTYTSLYKLSYYHDEWRMRVSEVSIGLLVKKTGLSERTVKRALSFLRSKRFIRLVWRGRPAPQDDRYLHSCYELPAAWSHVLFWRINKGRGQSRNPR